MRSLHVKKPCHGSHGTLGAGLTLVGWGVLDPTCVVCGRVDWSQPGGKAHTMRSGQELGL